MIGIVIVAHGGLAQEYLAALEHVMGKQVIEQPNKMKFVQRLTKLIEVLA